MTEAAEPHVGRSWEGHPLEDECPCPKEPCGLVRVSRADPTCEQHPIARARTIRQAHPPERCPAQQLELLPGAS